MSCIGVLDSGLGGIILLESLKKRYPKQDFIYFADQLNSPYGSKSEEELIRIVNQNLSWLKEQGADSIFFACNTISCLPDEKLQVSLPIQRVIEPTCRQFSSKDFKRILVCATPFTVSKGLYESFLSDVTDAEVISVGLEYLCRDIENLLEFSVIEKKLEADLHSYRNTVDAVVLGCTHYPYVKELFERILNVPVFDSSRIELEHTSEGSGQIRFWTTGSTEFLNHQCRSLLHLEIDAQKIEL